MKNEPCIRLGIRIIPKIRENPADKRKSKPPSAMLFTARMVACAEVICVIILGKRLRPRRAPTRLPPSCSRELAEGLTDIPPRHEGGISGALIVALFEILGRGIVARVDGVRQELLLVLGPALADARILLDRRVQQLLALALALTRADVADGLARLVGLDRSARRVGEPDLMQGLGQHVAVVSLPPGLRHSSPDALAGD